MLLNPQQKVLISLCIIIILYTHYKDHLCTLCLYTTIHEIMQYIVMYLHMERSLLPFVWPFSETKSSMFVRRGCHLACSLLHQYQLHTEQQKRLDPFLCEKKKEEQNRPMIIIHAFAHEEVQ